MILESASKFIASIIISSSRLTPDGFNALLNNIKNFQIIPREIIPTKKELPVGGYEMAIGMFKGLERKPG